MPCAPVPPVRCGRISDLLVEVLEPAGRLDSAAVYRLQSGEALVRDTRAALAAARVECAPDGGLTVRLSSLEHPESSRSALHGRWWAAGPNGGISMRACRLESSGCWRTWDADIESRRVRVILVDAATASVVHARGVLTDSARPQADGTVGEPDGLVRSGLPGSAPMAAPDVDQPIFDVELDGPPRPAVVLVNGYREDATVTVDLVGRAAIDAGGPGMLGFPNRRRDTIVAGAVLAVEALADEFTVPPVWWRDGRPVNVEWAALEIAFDRRGHTVRGEVRATLQDGSAVRYGISGVLRSRNVQRAREHWRHPRPEGRWLPVFGLAAPVLVPSGSANADGEPLRLTLPDGGWLRHVPALDVLVGLGGRGVAVARRETPVVPVVADLVPGDLPAFRQFAQDMALAGRPVEARPLLDRAAAMADAALAAPDVDPHGSGDNGRIDLLLLLNLQIRCASQTRDYPALLAHLRRAVQERIPDSTPASAQAQLVPALRAVRSTGDQVRRLAEFTRTMRDDAEASPTGQQVASAIPTAQLDEAVRLFDAIGRDVEAVIDARDLTEDVLAARFDEVVTSLGAMCGRLAELADSALDHPATAGAVTSAQRAECRWVVHTTAVVVRSTDRALEDELQRRDAALVTSVQDDAPNRGAGGIFLLQKDVAGTLLGAAAALGPVLDRWAERSPVVMLAERRLGNTEAALRFSGSVEQWRRRLNEDWERIAVVDAAEGFYEELVGMLLDLGAVEEAWAAAELGRARATADLLAQQPAGSAPSVATLRRAVDDLGHTVVEYFLREDELVVWLVGPGGSITCFRRALCRSELEADVARLHEIAGLPTPTVADRAEFAQLLRLLAARVWDPLPAASLPADPDEIVTVVPTGCLHRIPFPALIDVDGRHLVERHTLSVLPAVAIVPDLLGRDRPARFGGPVLALVNPAPMPYAHLGPLTDSEEGWPQLTELFAGGPVTTHRREDATLRRLREPEQPPAVVLLATHAEAEHVDGPFLALAPDEHHDGRVTPSDLVTLGLPGSVVLLSACHTAGGRITGDGVDGLSRGFLVGGASVLVLTLFEVVEPIALEYCYRLLESWRDGLGIEAAARSAQLALAAEHDDDPALWSPFVVHGGGVGGRSPGQER